MVKKYNGLDLSEQNRHNLREITKAFDKYAIREANERYERYIQQPRSNRGRNDRSIRSRTKNTCIIVEFFRVYMTP